MTSLLGGFHPTGHETLPMRPSSASRASGNKELSLEDDNSEFFIPNGLLNRPGDL